jgi:hypothetical protein
METVQTRPMPIAARMKEVKEAIESLDDEEEEKPVAAAPSKKLKPS